MNDDLDEETRRLTEIVARMRQCQETVEDESNLTSDDNMERDEDLDLSQQSEEYNGMDQQ